MRYESRCTITVTTPPRSLGITALLNLNLPVAAHCAVTRYEGVHEITPPLKSEFGQHLNTRLEMQNATDKPPPQSQASDSLLKRLAGPSTTKAGLVSK